MRADAGDSGADGADPVWATLEDQIAWYDGRSQRAQRQYRRIKVGELIVATSVPPLAGLRAPAALIAVLGSVVVLLEGFQHLFQYHERYISYRTTCEALKHERFLYLAVAGPYAAAAQPRALLAERVEGLLSQENLAWAATEQGGKDGPAKG